MPQAKPPMLQRFVDPVLGCAEKLSGISQRWEGLAGYCDRYVSASVSSLRRLAHPPAVARRVAEVIVYAVQTETWVKPGSVCPRKEGGRFGPFCANGDSSVEVTGRLMRVFTSAPSVHLTPSSVRRVRSNAFWPGPSVPRARLTKAGRLLERVNSDRAANATSRARGIDYDRSHLLGRNTTAATPPPAGSDDATVKRVLKRLKGVNRLLNRAFFASAEHAGLCAQNRVRGPHFELDPRKYPMP